MSLTIRERRRLGFHRLMLDRGLSRQQTSEILHVSFDTIKSWLKPETSTSSNPVPEWALELLALKVPVPDPVNMTEPGEAGYHRRLAAAALGIRLPAEPGRAKAKKAKAKPAKKRARR